MFNAVEIVTESMTFVLLHEFKFGLGVEAFSPLCLVLCRPGSQRVDLRFFFINRVCASER